MAVQALKKRTIFDALIFEPLELAVSQPHQFFISALSVYLVGSEAGMLAPSPFNWLMAVGAEWAYLRGLSSGEIVTTPWNKRLISAAITLLVLYGSLWGLRQFGALPKEHMVISGGWSIAGAVVLTLIHILTIGAVTFCSAMIHRDVLEAARKTKEQIAQTTVEREQRIQAERDALTLEWERKQQDLALWEQGQEAKARLKMQNANARTKKRRDALPASTNADPQTCPKCGTALDRPRWLAARRWGYCAACKEQS